MRYKLAVLALGMLCCFGCKETTKEEIKQQAEPLVEIVAKKSEAKSTYEHLDGSPMELDDYKGDRILLNYWATWCRPCIEEMPSLLEAQTILVKEGYIFRLVSNQSLEKIRAFDKKKNFDFVYVKYNGSLAEQQINALPATFIYNSEGVVVERIDGATDWTSPELLERLRNVK